MAQRPKPTGIEPAPINPPLKWAGGKRWLVPHVRQLWALHQTSRLVEPFCGGLAVALGLAPHQALLNDINPHVINFYRHLRRGLTIRLEMENDAAAFYAHRLRFNDLVAAGKTGTIEAASLFYYLNRTGYNGLCRFNSRGQFNVPSGRYARITYTRDFGRYVDIFANWEFRSADFESLRLRANDFVYADPPYDVPFTQYARGRFSWSDQIRVAEWLTQHPGPVVLSNQATPRIIALYTRLGYELRFLAAPRRISCTGDRAPAREVLATRNI
jgi:DNA adenine methylase